MPEKSRTGMVRRRHVAAGQVQGVGFRPFIYRIALENNLEGFVLNSSQGVVIEVQGEPDRVEQFAADLEAKLPPLARIVSLKTSELDPEPSDGAGFVIRISKAGEGHQVLISPDTATCADCLAEIFDPKDRRYGYPFTNCTNCGPRYTITRSIPYDREQTSMACFPMCEKCAREYSDPLDRRFHAQPNACPVCGPRVWLVRKGREEAEKEKAMEMTAQALAGGEIAAIKGLGGFHLACDATNHQAVMELRKRKNRWDKPLAVMVPDLDAAMTLAELNPAEIESLTGIERPITLCPAKTDSQLSPAIAPDTDYVGIMLPYAPLHHLLLGLLRRSIPAGTVPALVMTSGNMSSEPIALGNREAVARLSAIADLFLLHDRDILIRTDDSVVRFNPVPGKDEPRRQFLRRARGFTPKPVFLAQTGPSVLGLGPELKNTLCLTKGDQAFPSQHIGDMENLETFGFYKEIMEHLCSILQTRPKALVRDLHPDYLSSKFAEEQDEFPVLKLQHHYAHIHSVLAENRHQGPAVGLALDGTGLGDDQTLWGGECLFVDNQSLEHKRLAHFSPVMLPGGEAAIREPWRIAQAFLWELGITTPGAKPWPWNEKYARHSGMLPTLLKKGLNCPKSTSCGRLFDAVSAMLGITLAITYEGQAAIMLEHRQDRSGTRGYEARIRTDVEPAVLDTLFLFEQVFSDWEKGVAPEKISRRFHLGLAQGLAELAAALANPLGIREIPMSGGVMQNKTLHFLLESALVEQGLVPLVHTRVPPNDGCISLGQAAWGARRLTLDGLAD